MRSFDRSLRALNRSEPTRDQYLMSVGQMVDFFAAHRMPDTPTKVTRAHVEAFLADFATTPAPATVQTRYKCLKLFFVILKEEGEIRRDPMQSMKPLAVPEVPVAALSLEELDALLKTARGRDFVSRRDEAIMRLFVDTGMRRGELAALTVDNIDFEQDIAYVIGKGSRPRASPFGSGRDMPTPPIPTVPVFAGTDLLTVAAELDEDVVEVGATKRAPQICSGKPKIRW